MADTIMAMGVGVENSPIDLSSTYHRKSNSSIVTQPHQRPITHATTMYSGGELSKVKDKMFTNVTTSNNTDTQSDGNIFYGDIVGESDNVLYINDDVTNRSASTKIYEYPKVRLYYVTSTHQKANSCSTINTNTIKHLTQPNAADSLLLCVHCKLSFNKITSLIEHAAALHDIDKSALNLLEQSDCCHAVVQVNKDSSALLELKLILKNENKNDFQESLSNNHLLEVSSPCSIAIKAEQVHSYPSTTQHCDEVSVSRNDINSHLFVSVNSSANNKEPLCPTSASITTNATVHDSKCTSNNDGEPSEDLSAGTSSHISHEVHNCSSVECPKCDMILGSSRSLGGHMTMMHSRNSCKTLKCPKCNWHYKYQQTLEAHMKEKHPDPPTNCLYCKKNQQHPRLTRGETYSCGYKPFRCEICNYSTTTKGNLSIHMQSDKHLNNVQDIHKNGEAMIAAAAQHAFAESGANDKSKSKPVWRCDVCDYDTNNARNLRIHMTSEKHTQNVLLLPQTMQVRSYQCGLNNTSTPTASINELIGQHYSSATYGNLSEGLSGGKMMESGELLKYMNADENSIEYSDSTGMFICVVCGSFNCNELDLLHFHIHEDRTSPKDNDWLSMVHENIHCKLCGYSTSLKANFQLHCKTDKHMQKMQLVNHIKEGGLENEWQLKYLHLANPIQIKCTICEYYTNNPSKLLGHIETINHIAAAKLFQFFDIRRLQVLHKKSSVNDCVQYSCNICDFKTKMKFAMMQHSGSMAHAEKVQQNGYHPMQSFIGNAEYNKIFSIELLSADEHHKDGPSHVSHSPDPLQHGCNKIREQNFLDCPYCQYTSSVSEYMDAHLLTQHSISNYSLKFSCPLCQQKFPSNLMLETHLIEIHSVASDCVSKLIATAMNDQTQETASGILNSPTDGVVDETNDPECIDTATLNVKAANEIDPDQYRCHKCPNVFTDLDSMYTHQNESCKLDVQQTPRGPGYLCWKRGCNQYFKTQNSLQMHFREIHYKPQCPGSVNLNTYRFRCKQCTLAFKSAAKLQLHSQYHTIRDATTCNHCGKSFRTLGALQKHIDTSHYSYKDVSGAGQVEKLGGGETEKENKSGIENIGKLQTNSNHGASPGPLDLSSATCVNPPSTVHQPDVSKHSAQELYKDSSIMHKCHFCFLGFANNLQLNDHNKCPEHLEKKKNSLPDSAKFKDGFETLVPLKCITCKVEFCDQNALMIHYNSISHLNNLKISLTSDANMNEPEQSNLYQCKKCNMSFSHFLTFETHMCLVSMDTTNNDLKRKASNGDTSYGSSNPFISTSLYPYTSHLPFSSHAGPINVFPPTSQPVKISTSSAENLLNPFYQPFTSSALFTCPKCASMFASQDALEKHQQIHCYFGDMSAQLAAYAVNAASLNMPMAFPPSSSVSTIPIASSSSIPTCTTTTSYVNASQTKICKSSSMKLVQRQLLQSIGFELVLQYSENTLDAPSKDIADTLANSQTCDVESGFFKCRLCEKIFSSMWVMKAHLEEVHKELTPIAATEEASNEFISYINTKYSEEKELTPDISCDTVPVSVSNIDNTMVANFLKSQAAPMESSAGVINSTVIPPSVLSPMIIPTLSSPMLQLPENILQTGSSPLLQIGTKVVGMKPHCDGYQEIPLKRPRTRITDDQLKVLRTHFDINNSPNDDQIANISQETVLPVKVIKHWFRNTLFKERQRNKDSPYNFNNPPSTPLAGSATESNRNIPQVNNLISHEIKEEVLENIATIPTHLKSEVFVKKENSLENIVDNVRAKVIKEEPLDSKGYLEHQAQSTNLVQSSSLPMYSNYSLSGTTNSLISPYNFPSYTAGFGTSTTYPHLYSNSSSTSSETSYKDTTSHMFHTADEQSRTPSHMFHTADEQSRYDLSKRAGRTRFTDWQIQKLQEFFEINAYPKDDDLDTLSKDLSLNPRVIVVWFQNQRQKARKSFENLPMENDDDSSGRYFKTPNLNYQCKECSHVFQRFIDLIKHQKEVCFKDSFDHHSPSNQTDKIEENSKDGGGKTLSNMEYPCNKCTMVFNSLPDWEDHQQLHLMPAYGPTYYPSLMNASYPMMYMSGMENYLPNMGALPSSSIASPFSMNSQLLSNSDCKTTNSSSNIGFQIGQEKYCTTDDGGLNSSKDRRLRTSITPKQLNTLYKWFKENSNPSRKMLEIISVDVSLKKRVVQVWFQNTRARQRKASVRQTESQMGSCRCPFCFSLFNSEVVLDIHMRNKHSDAMTDIYNQGLPIPKGIHVTAGPFVGDNSANMNNSDVVDNAKNYSDDVMDYEESELVIDDYGYNLCGKGDGDDDDFEDNDDPNEMEQGTSYAGGAALDLTKAIGNNDTEAPFNGSYNNIYKSFEANLSSPARQGTLVTDRNRRVSTPISVSVQSSTANAMNDDSESSLTHVDMEYSDGDPTSPLKLRDDKRYRTQLSHLQIRVLKACYVDYKTPTMNECEELGKTIGLAKRVVQVWFQNARAKDKKSKQCGIFHTGGQMDTKPPSQCLLCNVKYSVHLTGRDHVFGSKHLETLVKRSADVSCLAIKGSPPTAVAEPVLPQPVANCPTTYPEPTLPKAVGVAPVTPVTSDVASSTNPSAAYSSMMTAAACYPFIMGMNPYVSGNPFVNPSMMFASQDGAQKQHTNDMLRLMQQQYMSAAMATYPNLFASGSYSNNPPATATTGSNSQYMCNRCRLTFDTKELALAHQRSICFYGLSVNEADTITHLTPEVLTALMGTGNALTSVTQTSSNQITKTESS